MSQGFRFTARFFKIMFIAVIFAVIGFGVYFGLNQAGIISNDNKALLIFVFASIGFNMGIIVGNKIFLRIK